MVGAIVRCDRGAAAPLKPMARAQGSEQRRRTASTHRARDQSKCAGEPSARTRRLLHDRHGGGATKSSVELAAWLHAFTGPVTGDKRPRASDAPVTDGQGSARRVRHAALHAAPAPPNQ